MDQGPSSVEHIITGMPGDVSLDISAKRELKDANKIALWDENGTIFYATWKARTFHLRVYPSGVKFKYLHR